MKYGIQSLVLVALLMLSTESTAQFGKLLDKAKTAVSGGTGLSQADIGNGLKEALEVGVTDAVSTLSTEDGYLASAYKIELPSEASKVASKLKMVPGFSNVEAAQKATPIFVNAIKEMTFADAKNILVGEDNAATTYLQKSSREKLYAEFMPIIQKALDEVNIWTYCSEGRRYPQRSLTKK